MLHSHQQRDVALCVRRICIVGYTGPGFINAVIRRSLGVERSAVGSTGGGESECGEKSGDWQHVRAKCWALCADQLEAGESEGAQKLNALIRLLATREDWRHFVVRMHPATWSRIMPYLDYNLSFPKPGVPMDMDGGPHDDVNTIKVVWREVVRHPY